VLDTAEQVLATEGAEALTTTRVAEAAGVSVGSLYQYLPDKGAIVQALARRYLADFEGLMGELERDARRSGGEGWEDPVGRLIDAFSDRYRELPGYRALWFGRELSDEMREADRENKVTLGRGVRKNRRCAGTRPRRRLPPGGRPRRRARDRQHPAGGVPA
jgi:AcrR family transcriptional regulator